MIINNLLTKVKIDDPIYIVEKGDIEIKREKITSIITSPQQNIVVKNGNGCVIDSENPKHKEFLYYKNVAFAGPYNSLYFIKRGEAILCCMNNIKAQMDICIKNIQYANEKLEKLSLLYLQYVGINSLDENIMPF